MHMVLYIKSVIEADPKLDEKQTSVLFIDAYPVHTGMAF